MSTLDQARETQLRNIETKTGKTLAPLRPIHDRLMAEKPGGMCQFKVKVTGTHEVDAELVGWLRQAYDAAG